MAREYNYATKYSTTQIIAKAYKEYCTEAAERYATLIEIADRVVSEVSDETADVNATVNSILADYSSRGIGKFDNIVLLDAPYQLVDLYKAIGRSVKADMEAIKNGENLGKMPVVSTVDVTGAIKTFEMPDLFSEMNAAYHAITVEKAVASAYDIGGTITDKVSCIRDVISDTFSNSYVDVSNSLSDALDKVRNGVNIIDYVKQRTVSGGLVGIRNDEIDNLGQSEDVAFTGATPMSAMASLAAGKQILSTTGKVMKAVANTAWTVLSGIFTLGKKLVTGVAKKVYQTTVNPYDVRLANDKGNNTINDYYTKHIVSLKDYDFVASKLAEGPIHFDFIPCEVILQARKANIVYPVFTDVKDAFNQLMLNQLGYQINGGVGLLDAINYETRRYYGNLYEAANDLFNLQLVPGVDNLLDGLNQYAAEISGIVTTAEELIKIKPINSDLLFDKGSSTLRISETPIFNGEKIISHKFPISEIIEVLDDAANTNAYTSVDREEKDFYRDFITGAFLTNAVMGILRLESLGQALDGNVYITGETTLLSMLSDLPSKVTNADFFNLVTELKSHAFIAEQDIFPIITLPISGFVSTLNNVFEYRNAHPFDYTFWPYSRNYANWFEGSFELVSDAENARAFTNFLTAAIVIVLVATIAVTATVTLKKRFMKAQADLMGKEWALTDLASKGEDVSGALKDYKKAKRKANKLAFLTGNLTKAASGLSSNDAGSVDLTPIINLIR